MKKLWESLKPQERRAVAAIGIVFFLVLNYFFVWPQFKQWGVNQQRRKAAEDNIKTYQEELKHKDEYTRRIRNFDTETVQLEDQDIHFENYILDRMSENGVQRENQSPLRKTTYEYFLEKQVTVQVVAPEQNLVNFLYSLGSSNSLVRVRNLRMNVLDLSRLKLHADVVISASYQKTTPNKPEAPAAKPAAVPAAKPAPPAPKPATVTNKPATPNIKRP